jgi:hypothetical protein
MIIVNKLPNNLQWLCPVDGPVLTRLGNFMDGGYVVPLDLINQSQALISLGLGDNWSFDQDWHAKKPQDPIHMYDGTVIKDQLKVAYNVGVRGHIDLQTEYEGFFQGQVQHFVENVGPGPGQTSLATCLARLDEKNVFIKMDIEGGEYVLINDLINYRDRITGMVMEFHFCNGNRTQFETAVKMLQAHYSIVHLHANNHVDIGPEGLTDCLELTFMNNNRWQVNDKPRYNFYIDGLDFSNVAGIEDHRYCF